MNQTYKNSRRPLLWWAALCIFVGLALLPMFSFAEGTNSAPNSTPPAAANSLQGLLLVLIPVAVPLLVAAGKYFLPNVPTVLLPILAPALGALIDWLTSLATGHAASPVLALVLGSAGVGLREIVDQISKTRNAGKAPFMALLILPVLLGGSGCASLSNPQTSQRIASASKVAAYVGTTEFLREHPETREGFVAARDALQVIETSEHVDLAALLKIVNQLPVKELKSERAVMVITAGTILLNDYAGSLPVEKLDDLKPVAKAIREGIDLGLN